jgi:hypothetical protein
MGGSAEIASGKGTRAPEMHQHVWQPLDLYEAGVSMIPLRVIAKILYGTDMSEDNLQKIQSFVPLHNQVFASTHHASTKFWFYEYVPTSYNSTLKKFTTGWRQFHENLYKENKHKYGSGTV